MLIEQVLEGADLDFSRYGDTLFEVLFAGGRLAGGGNVVEEGKKLDTNVSLHRPQHLPTLVVFITVRLVLCTSSAGIVKILACRSWHQMLQGRAFCHM